MLSPVHPSIRVAQRCSRLASKTRRRVDGRRLERSAMWRGQLPLGRLSRNLPGRQWSCGRRWQLLFPPKPYHILRGPPGAIPCIRVSPTRENRVVHERGHGSQHSTSARSGTRHHPAFHTTTTTTTTTTPTPTPTAAALNTGRPLSTSALATPGPKLPPCLGITCAGRAYAVHV